MGDYPPMKYPEWQRSLMDALSELLPENLPRKIQIAEFAVFRRLKEWPSLSEDERTALKDGLRTLSDLMPARHKEIKLKYPAWQIPYREALAELDLVTFVEKVKVAKAALYARLQELRPLSNPELDEERHAINDALNTLNRLSHHSA